MSSAEISILAGFNPSVKSLMLVAAVFQGIFPGVRTLLKGAMAVLLGPLLLASGAFFLVIIIRMEFVSVWL